MWENDGGLFGQSQMRRGMGAVSGPPQQKRNGQDPAPKGYGGSGLGDITPPGPAGGGNPIEGGFGGGGPMPVPTGGTGWRTGGPVEDSGSGGFNPMGDPHGFGDQMGGGFNPMPTPPPWKGRNPEDFGVTMEFGGPGAINPPGMGPQDLRNLYNPPPPPAPSPIFGGNTGVVPPHLGGGLWDSVQGGGGPMPIPPKGGGGQSGYMGGPRINGGPYGPPRPQGGPATDQMGSGGGPMPMPPDRGLWGFGGQRGQFPQGIDPNLLRYLLMRRG